MLKKYKWVYIAIMCTLFIIVGSLINLSDAPKVSLSFGDKLIHMFCYGLCFMLWYIACLSLNKRNTFWLIAISIFSLGVLMEFLQSLLTVDRVADFFDILANTLGIALAAVLIKTTRLKEVLKTLI